MPGLIKEDYIRFYSDPSEFPTSGNSLSVADGHLKVQGQSGSVHLKQEGSQLFVVDNDGNQYSITTNVPKVFSYSNLTPTHYFDPTATSSSGAGTYANPFRNNDDLRTYITSVSGDMRGKILGLKRGTTYLGYLNLYQTNGSGNDIGGVRADSSYPLFVVPYGDAEAKPKITQCMPSTGWVADGTYPQLYKKTLTAQEEIYFTGGYSNPWDYRRLVTHSSITSAETLVAKGAGYVWWDSSNSLLYMYPIESGNPNLGQYEETFGTKATLEIRYANVAESGSIKVYGLRIDGSHEDSVLIQPTVSNASITSIKGLVVADCEIGRSGTDNTSQSTSTDALNIIGKSASVRHTGTLVANNIFYHARNNALETTSMDGMICEWNKAYKIGGKSIVELWAACSNGVFRYNYGENYNASGDPFGKSLSLFSPMGFWQTGYAAMGSTTPSASANANNVFAFNHVRKGYNYACSIDGGSAILVNNTLEGGYISNSGSNPSIFIGLYGGTTADQAATVTLVNNHIIRDYSADTSLRMIQSNATLDTLTGGGNVFDSNNIGPTKYTYFKWRNVDTTGGSSAAQIASLAGQPGVTSFSAIFSKTARKADGTPLANNNTLRNAGVTYSGITDNSVVYGKTLDGRVRDGINVGAY